MEDEWPLPEIREDMSGHYVLNLTEVEFDERLGKFDKLDLEKKLRLLIDRDLITKAGMQSAAGLVSLALKFKNENSAAVWNKLAAIVGNLKVYVDDESEEEKLLKKYTFELVDEKLEEVGLRTNKDDDENMIRLRANLMALDYFAEDKKRLEQLAGMYEDDYQKMDAEIRSDILSAKVYLEPKVVDGFVEKYREIADPDVKFDYLAAATLVRDEKELLKLIELLGENEIVKPQDQFYLFLWLYRNPKVRMKVFDWLTENWEIVKKIGGDKSLEHYPTYIARLARTEGEFDKYVKFFGLMRDDPALKRAISIGENEIKARIKLISKGKTKVVEAIKTALK